jgi:uncharacterized protein (DUF952 family)
VGPAPEATLLHLLPRAEWDAFLASGGTGYRPASLASEGFVHCTGTDELLLRVANAFYRSIPGEVAVLVLDPSRLSSPVVWEAPPGSDPLAEERFPHLYGPIDRDAVVRVRTLVRGRDGTATGITP